MDSLMGENTTLQMASSNSLYWMKNDICWLKFHCNLLTGAQFLISKHLLDNILVPNKRQTITWTSGELVYWPYMRHSSSMDLRNSFCSWIGLDLFNDDTRPSGHISRPTQVNVSQKCLHSLNKLFKSDHIVQVSGLVEVDKLHHIR